MMQVYKRDDNGWYLGPIWIDQGQSIPADCRVDGPAGFYKAKRNAEDSGWVEGATQEEIDAIKNAPQTLSPIEQQLAEKDLQIRELKAYTQQLNDDFAALAEFVTNGGN
jgi:hypothetical protein